MSKFFDDTLKARNSAPQAAAQQAVLQQMVAAVKAPGNAASDLGGGRLERCRKIRLPRSTGLPILTGGNDLIEVAVESYRALRIRLMRSRATEGLQSVVITSATQGEGKTLTALNLALCCAQLRDPHVLLVDGDLRTRGLTRLLGFPSSPGLAEVLRGQAEPEAAILSTDLPNLFVLGTGSSSGVSPELFAGRRWQEFIGWCSESFRLVLVDAPPILLVADCELITAACDGVLMVVRALHTKRELLRKAASQIEAKKLLGIVHNAVEDGYSKHCYPRLYVDSSESK